jgi:hypothetical protein
MSDNTVTTIDLTDEYRIVVEYDQSPSNPRSDWDCFVTGFHKIDGEGNSRIIDVEPIWSFPDQYQLDNAHERWYTRTNEHCSWRTDTDRVERWARIFYGMHIEYDAEHGGYWFVSPDAYEKFGIAEPEDRLAFEKETIEQERRTYQRWAEGEVYVLSYEKRSYWSRVDKSGTPIFLADEVVREDWETLDSLSDVYLDNPWSDKAVATEARDHFSIEDDAETALLKLIEG